MDFTPFNAVLGLAVGPENHIDSFLLIGRVLIISITLGFARQYRLDVAHEPLNALLKQRFLVPDTFVVNKVARFFAIDSVDDKVKTFPKLIIESFLGFVRNESLNSRHV